ncbi:MAG: catechol 2,3-dioxygenase-like lactoylglutathione lyase family enzyme [Halioglobus sp.]|jgi:catechol 2,3-dioxygenase-like lactoylglutathione lyase family enzyme
MLEYYISQSIYYPDKERNKSWIIQQMSGSWMISAFDRIVIAVPDLSAAVADYGVVLGGTFWPVPDDSGMRRAWLGLKNVVIELRELQVAQSMIVGVVFIDESAAAEEREVSNTRLLSLQLCNGQRTESFRQAQPHSQNLDTGVDHLVLRTSDAQACIQLFAIGLGLRLALDKSEPDWGGRMLFFRVGKLTLEVIESSDAETGPDRFWGIAYRCSDLSATAARLKAEGVALSAVRHGRKPGTNVATLKSHAFELPTLLIGVKPT